MDTYLPIANPKLAEQAITLVVRSTALRAHLTDATERAQLVADGGPITARNVAVSLAETLAGDPLMPTTILDADGHTDELHRYLSLTWLMCGTDLHHTTPGLAADMYDLTFSNPY